MARGPLRVSPDGRIPNATPRFGTLDFAARTIPGGKRLFIECARLARGTDPRVDLVVSTWDQLSPYKQKLFSLEELCAAAGLAPGEFYGIAARACFEFNGGVAMFKAAMAFPAIMQAATVRACTPAGFKERRMFFEYSGHVPSRSRVVTVKVFERAPARAAPHGKQQVAKRNEPSAPLNSATECHADSGKVRGAITPDLRAMTWTIIVRPNPPALIDGRSVRAPLAEDLRLEQRGHPEWSVRPPHVSQTPVAWDNAVGVSVKGQGLSATVDPSTLPAGDLDVIILAEGSAERRYVLSQSGRAQIR